MERSHSPLLEEIPLSGPVSVSVREFEFPAFTYPWHQHPEVELAWVMAGSGLRYVGDSVEPFQAGDFCLLGSNLPHTWLSPHPAPRGPVRSFVVQFDPTRLGGSVFGLPEMTAINRLLKRAEHGLRFDPELGNRLRKKMQRQPTPLRRMTTLLETLEELAACPDAKALSLAAWTQNQHGNSDPRFSRVLTYLSEHVGEPISQAGVAQLAGLSPAAFSRFFQRAMGKTFQSYVTDLRLSAACRLLLETDRTVSEIAYASGFGNLSNFNRSFRQRRGMAPRAFRRQSLSAAGS